MSEHWLRRSGLPERHLTALRYRHGEPWRHYHVWAHVEALFAELGEVEDRLSGKRAVAVAVLYHDAVYDPRSARNERYSAELMTAECAGLVEPEDLAAADIMIRATEGHALPEGSSGGRAQDMRFFLDADLAILGAGRAVFDAYEDAVRREYAHVPEAEFRRGRSSVLRGFLDRPALYFSTHFRAKYEERARNNLRRSLQRLG